MDENRFVPNTNDGCRCGFVLPVTGCPLTQVTGLDPESIRKTQGTRFGSVSLVFPDA